LLALNHARVQFRRDNPDATEADEEFALFDLLMTYHHEDQRLALLALNESKVQFKLDNERAEQADTERAGQ
jgi:hypothetical protein